MQDTVVGWRTIDVVGIEVVACTVVVVVLADCTVVVFDAVCWGNRRQQQKKVASHPYDLLLAQAPPFI